MPYCAVIFMTTPCILPRQPPGKPAGNGLVFSIHFTYAMNNSSMRPSGQTTTGLQGCKVGGPWGPIMEAEKRSSLKKNNFGMSSRLFFGGYMWISRSSFLFRTEMIFCQFLKEDQGRIFLAGSFGDRSIFTQMCLNFFWANLCNKKDNDMLGWFPSQ